MAHIRRHFESALEENKAAAEYAIGEIQKLYRIEKICDEQQLTDEKLNQYIEDLHHGQAATATSCGEPQPDNIE